MLRNREFRQFAILFFFMAAIASLLGFAISTAAGILAAVSSAAFGTAFFLFTKARYNSIAQISNQIDVVLHNADQLFIGDSDEGELSILSSEVSKMTQRIREQNSALKKGKEQLADSLADIAHQLRTPLTSITLILSLAEAASDEHERRKLLKEAEDLLVRMDWLLTSLLKLSRLDAGIVTFQTSTIDLNHLVNDALRPLLIPMELHGIAVHTEIPEEASITGDAGWLSEALQNILKNCMESAGNDGTIEIGCEDNLLYTELTIHDSGPGFDKDVLPCLFERFYRGRNTDATGFGIGLALCRTIVTRQGGSVTAKNHPQGGALFAIRFPK